MPAPNPHPPWRRRRDEDRRVSHSLLFEIGCEELPPSYVPPALEQLAALAREGLAQQRLTFDDARTSGTPRRLTLAVSGLGAHQPDRDEEAQGPAVNQAYDAEGRPTRALLGFCQGRGVDPATVRRVMTPRGERVAVTVHHHGRPAAAVLPELLGALAGRLVFPKTMRWLPGDDTRFARPVRWLVALLDDQVLPVRAFGLEAGRATRGHRFLAPAPAALAHARDYDATLAGAHVVADPERRRTEVASHVAAAARAAGGRVVEDDELIEINNFLLEEPRAFAGHFDARYLDLPREVIVTALREHQRFFAVEDAAARLLPAFVALRDGGERGMERVRKGNEDVLVARLEDARFYWETDVAKPPATQLDALAHVVWIEGLGSLRDKAERLERLGAWLAQRLAPTAEPAVRRAALLCKTDLLSEMIGSGKEYASLEGIMGGHYARRAGEPEAVATAIAEHYRPRGPMDVLPASEAGALLALADKLDHVAGAFMAGKAPSGGEDPYGVRRAGNGVVRIVIEQQRHLDLQESTVESTAVLFHGSPDAPHAEIMRRLREFWRGRVEAALDDRGIAYDARDAALEARVAANGRTRPGWIDPADALTRARVLSEFRADARFEPLVILFKRVANILAKATEPLPEALDRARLTEPAERALVEALDRAAAATGPLWERHAYAAILPALLEMEHAIHAFFDAVMVNVEDAPTRLNRLRLLAGVRELFLRGWDLSRIVVEGERS
jgi:glycyl-tRNA synthetase beta chain